MAWWIVSAFVAGTLLYGFLFERLWLRVKRFDVQLPRLPQEMDGLRIAFLSDFHIGQAIAQAASRRAVAAALKEKPDLILLGGDFLYEFWPHPAKVSQILAPLEAALGAYGVLGNHDFRGHTEEAKAALAAAGIQLLENKAVWLSLHSPTSPQAEKALVLIGLEEMEGGRPDFAAALRGIPKNATVIALCHNPDLVRQAAEFRVDLMLSGHTHGGQIRLPIFDALLTNTELPRKYAEGLFCFGPTQLLVTRGVGIVGLPVRFMCRPEVCLITLRAASS
jgi:hypothetical protein